MKKNKIKITYAGNIITNVFEKYIKVDNLNLKNIHTEFNQILLILNKEINTDVLILHITKDFFIDENYKIKVKIKNRFFSDLKKFLNLNKCMVILNTIDNLILDNISISYFRKKQQIDKINNKLYSLNKTFSNVHLLDCFQILLENGISQSISKNNFFIMKMPYTSQVLSKLGQGYSKLIKNYFFPRSKMILVDADNTLWHGVIGEEKIEDIKIDDEYPGIIFTNFQKQLIELVKSGILLVLLTKNNEEDINFFFKNKKMPLKLSHFSYVSANWEPKSENINKISKIFNISTDSMIFIDDNDFEINQVKCTFKNIQAIKFNYKDTERSLSLLHQINSLNSKSLTDEDEKKNKQYKSLFKRESHKKNFQDINKYIDSLKINISVFEDPKDKIERVTQLINKTNQFNLTTRRYTKLHVEEFINNSSSHVYAIRVEDIYEDMGIVCVVILINNHIDTFLLSCRAFGRNIEKVVLNFLMKKLKSKNITSEYVPSKKNKFIDKFYTNNGFKKIKNKLKSNNQLYKFEKFTTIDNNISIKLVNNE